MKFSRYCLLFILPLALNAGLAPAQQPAGGSPAPSAGQDPSSLYLDAYFAIRDAEQLAGKKDFEGAVKKGDQAERILQTIAAKHPDWQKNMVSLRRQTNANNLEKWNQAARENPRRRAGTDALVEGASPAAPANREGASRPAPPSFDEIERRRQQRASAANPTPARSFELPVQPAEPQTPYERLEAELLKVTVENRALVRALRSTRSQLVDALAQKANAEAGESVYKEKFEKLSAELAHERANNGRMLETLTQKYNEVEAALQKSLEEKKLADEKIAHFQNLLAETQNQLEEVTRDRDNLRTERDQLAQILEFNSPEKTKALLDNNLTLASKLKEAQERIAKLESEQAGDEDQMAANLRELEITRTEVTQLKALLAAAHDENIGYRRRITELNQRLINTDAELDNLSKQSNADPLAIEENQVLRSIIAKQIKLLAMQQKGRELLIEAYKRLHLNNPEIENALDLLEDDASLKLTPAEAALAQTFSPGTREAEASSDEALANFDSLGDTLKKELKIEILGNTAAESFKKGHFAVAEELYHSILDMKPDHLAARVNIGAILVKRNKPAEALEHLKRADELSPNTAPILLTMGYAYMRESRDKEAMKAFEQAVTIEPDNELAYLYMGNLESSAGNAEQAIAHYDHAIRIAPSLADAHFNKSHTLAGIGRITQARKAYDQAIAHGAAPDFELQRILDPNGATLPLPPAPATAPDPGGERALAATSPEASTLDPKPQEEKVRDASAIPEQLVAATTQKESEPAPAQRHRSVLQPVKHTPESEQTVPKAAPAAIKPVQVQQTPPAAEEKPKPLPPKNMRRFRFG